MKKLTTVIFILLFSVPAFSQFLNFGIKAGVESNTTPEYNVSRNISHNFWIIESMKNASWGFHGGIFTRINIFSLYIQPEVVFASTSFDYTLNNWVLGSTAFEVSSYTKSQKFNRLSVPLLVGMKLGPLRINAGPAANILIETPKALIDAPNFDEIYKGAVWGLQAGVGIDIFQKLTIDVRYAGSLGRQFGDVITIGSQNYRLDHEQRTFLLSVGWMF